MALGLTKYGFKLQFLRSSVTSSKSYSWVNFRDDEAATKNETLREFLLGATAQNNTGLRSVINAMGSPYSINGQSITQENAVTFE